MVNPSQRARVLLELAMGEDELGRTEAAKTALDEALGLALQQQDWSLAQQIATVLVVDGSGSPVLSSSGSIVAALVVAC